MGAMQADLKQTVSCTCLLVDGSKFSLFLTCLRSYSYLCDLPCPLVMGGVIDKTMCEGWRWVASS